MSGSSQKLEDVVMKRSISQWLLYLLVLPFFLASYPHTARAQTEIPLTGMAVPEMASYDRMISDLMTKYNVPGGAVAVVKDGRLIYARGYGYADKELPQLVQPDSLFRIASLSKPITAAAILKLAEEGKLNLEAKAFTILNDIQPTPGVSIDPRLRDITVRQLLHHAGGWNRDTGFDPMFQSSVAAQSVGYPYPAGPETVIRYMLGQALQFTPGSEYHYSNFGYAILGRIIEKVTGQTYQNYVKARILKPAGITCMRIGGTLEKDRAAKEVHYFHRPQTELASSVFPGVTGNVLWPHGGFYLEAMDSHGGWIASVIDLVRFINVVDRRSTKSDILSTATINTMIARPAIPEWQGSSYYYAMGWSVRPTGNDANWWHDGSLPGTRSLMVRAYNGLTWAALFNTRVEDDSAFLTELDRGLWQASAQVTRWPAHDLFSKYTSECASSPDYTIVLSADSQSLTPGLSTTFTIGIQNAASLNKEIAPGVLSQSAIVNAAVSPPDSGITLNLSSFRVKAGGSTAITVHVSPATSRGNYQVNITGIAAGIVKNAKVMITVGALAPVPSITSVVFETPDILTIQGSKFSRKPRVLINNTDRSEYIQSPGDSLVRIKGNAKNLGLKTGSNDVQVIDASGGVSNIFTLRI
jgi:CubicO group peptidase (beta-lactamase class C family)